jgi:hypothetical protein
MKPNEEAAHAEALRLVGERILGALLESAATPCNPADTTSHRYHWLMSRSLAQGMDKLIARYALDGLKFERNDVIRAAVRLFLADAESTVMLDRTQQARATVEKLLALLSDLPKEDCQVLRRKLFEI